MRVPLTSTEQLLPFPSAEELLAKKRDALVSVPPQAKAFEALQRMAEKHIGFLLVIESGTLVGVPRSSLADV